MPTTTLVSITGLLSLVVSAVGCSGQPSRDIADSEGNTTPRVFVVSYPLAYFARRIGGEIVDVHFPVPRHVDPRVWRPDANVINAFQQADVIFINGADFARWTNRVSLPGSKVVNTTANAVGEYISSVDGVTHQHGPEGTHTHTGFASTTWLDFKMAATQARAIKDALTKRLPQNATAFQVRFEKLLAELDALDEKLLNVSADTEPPELLCAQPVYQYLARRYHLRVQCVQWERGQMPSEAAWEDLADRLGGLAANGMLFEKEPLPEIRERLHRLGIEVIVYDPASNIPESGDFLEVMRENVANLSGRVR